MPLRTERIKRTFARSFDRVGGESDLMFARRVESQIPQLREDVKMRYPNRRVRVVVNYAPDYCTASVLVSTLKDWNET